MIEDFDLPVINRSLLTIEAKEPFVEWLNSIRGEEELNLKLVHTVESVNEELVAYLIPELADNEDQELFLERFWVTLFELQRPAGFEMNPNGQRSGRERCSIPGLAANSARSSSIFGARTSFGIRNSAASRSLPA